MNDYIIRKITKKTSKKIYHKFYDKKMDEICHKKTINNLIENIYIPPAYNNVKINCNKNQKIRAIGYDMKVLEIINLHETMGNIVTWGSTLVFFVWLNVFFKNMEDKRMDKLAFAFLFILTCCVFFTAYLGGQLVWIYGVGTP